MKIKKLSTHDIEPHGYITINNPSDRIAVVTVEIPDEPTNFSYFDKVIERIRNLGFGDGTILDVSGEFENNIKYNGFQVGDIVEITVKLISRP